MENRIFDAIIIGAGPAGIFTALELTHLKPESQVLIVDMGRAIAHRTCPARTTGKCVHCDPCGIVHGWAGAGAFSDGKLSLSDEVGGHISEYLGHPKAQELIHQADELYLRFGAPKEVHGLDDKKVEEIAYEASRYNIRLVPCPVRHLGTEYAGSVLAAMHDYLTTQTHTTFAELTTAVAEMDAALQKSAYATSESLLAQLCTELFGRAMSAQMAIGELPYGNVELAQTASFVAKVGDYAAALSRSNASGGGTTEEEKESLHLTPSARGASEKLVTFVFGSVVLTFPMMEQVSVHSSSSALL